ncbi:hypothetical protein CDD80_2196 [Ophiocordyceps camponoti-rufipedis]|uniref:Ams2/SPT21 N-terminal domain-containing protein n=1 Tax=Ophiocordyceps camponoti-rufipedis TaxID=2004952 RepID=A0A2C5Z3T1_9HYPO|nr:hypothetical protein CDD80_2196 [Ophiocordyceps camponoti-rufipedis]
MAKPRPLDDHKMPAPPPPAGPQYRPMGLKVHYTFDKDARINCLARHPQVLHLQAISIDDVTTIGIVDLRACLDAIIECSPELASGQSDFSIYTVDYSEPDTPFVGQGLLSWALDSMRPEAVHRPPKLVVGRVAKSLLAVFNAGSRETLEVRIRFFESAPIQRGNRHGSVDFQQCQPFDRPADKPQSEFAATPSAASDWNPFSQNDNQTTQAASESRLPSRAQSPGPMVRANSLESSSGPSAPQPGVISHQSTFMAPQPDMAQPQPSAVNEEAQHVASTPIDAPEEATRASEAPSQASSQASTRGTRKRPAVTGRPRGRPRKKPAASDGPSGHDETTEGEDGPTRKRAKVTRAGKSAANPFASEPESLRVAASTSSSLRSFRPVASSSNEGAAASDPQEVPRAPTPIPRGGSVARQTAREPVLSRLRQESIPAQQLPTALYSDSRLQPLSPSQEDGRSPDSLGPTPAYSEDSIASSPPMQHATSFMRSSPPPSSPVLPPMPSTELQLDFANDDDMDDLFGEEPPRPEPPVTAPTCDMMGKSGAKNNLDVSTPFQAFQMQDGSNGDDLILLNSQNDASEFTPASTKQQPVVAKPSISLPRLEKDSGHKQARPGISRPTMEPTPPPTTDAVERPTSPGPGPEPSTISAQPEDQSCAAPVPESAEESSSSSLEKSDASKSPAQQPSSIKPSLQKAFQASKCKSVRSLMRSQSAGAAALALPSTPASEPAGPLSASQSTAATTALPGQNRSVSSGPLILPVPASDPVRPSTQMDEVESRELSMSLTDITAPPSPPARSNKNKVKKQAIKQRLEEAILNGEMPPFCSNCGAIETPTWRKIWVQDRDGVPKYCEYSEKPGRVTAIEIMTRDAEEKPTSYRLVKKSLGPNDDKTAWKELLLCNPCGIWLTKCKCHRPPDRWDKDLTRVGQERRRKTTTGANNNPRPRKPRAKSDAAANPTSDAHPVADALGIIDVTSPKASGPELSDGNAEHHQSRQPAAVGSTPAPVRPRGSGTAMSPVRLDFDEAVGSTKRLLFPSPRKEGVAKVLGEMEVNKAEGNKVPPALDDSQTSKGDSDDKENAAAEGVNVGHDDVGALNTLKSPQMTRPSTPPPDANKMTSPFKTPTRVPGSHRPVTRSVSRSLRSNRSAVSPIQAQHTPTKTAAHDSFALPESPIFSRRSPRNHQGPLDGCDTPISRTISQMFSDPANFGLVDDMDLVTLPALDADTNQFDFDKLMSTDGVMAPSSPLRGDSLGFDYLNSANIWGQWTLDNSGDVSMSEG